MSEWHFLYSIKDKQRKVIDASEWWTDTIQDDFDVLLLEGQHLHLYDIVMRRVYKEIVIHETAELLRKHSPYMEKRIGYNHLSDYLNEEECASFSAAFLADDPERNDNPFHDELSIDLSIAPSDEVICDKCCEMFDVVDILEMQDGTILCRKCAGKAYVKCDSCEEYYPKRQLKEYYDGRMLCKDCFKLISRDRIIID